MSASREQQTWRGLDLADLILTWVVFTGIALLLYAPALNGPLLSDDLVYLTGRPYMLELSPDNVEAILDPTADPAIVTSNYAPVHLLAHLVEHEFFGSYRDNTRPYHIVNVVLHATNALLFAALLASQGVPLLAGLLAGLLFLIHPANVEVGAWIVQLKTLLAFGLSLGALLALRRHPTVGTLLYALALLSKPTATAALAGGIVFEWTRTPAPGEPPRRTRWLVAWGLLTAVYCLAEFHAFQRTGELVTGQERGVVAIGLQAVAILGRYLVMAITSLGVSTSQQPAAPDSVLDPWFMLGVLTLIGLVGVSVRTLMRRHPAAGWLGFSAAAYLPISQLFPFRFPMADRYLYFAWAGLVGAALLGMTPWLRRLLAEAKRSRRFGQPPALWILTGVILLASLGLGVHTHERAAVWRSQRAFEQDAIAHYPRGISGLHLRAKQLAQAGDLEGSIDALESARAQGYVNVLGVLSDPGFAPLHGQPRFQNLMHEMAMWWVEHIGNLESPTQYELIDLCQIYLALGDPNSAIATIHRAQETRGTASPLVLKELLARAQLQRRQKEHL